MNQSLPRRDSSASSSLPPSDGVIFVFSPVLFLRLSKCVSSLLNDPILEFECAICFSAYGRFSFFLFFQISFNTCRFVFPAVTLCVSTVSPRSSHHVHQFYFRSKRASTIWIAINVPNSKKRFPTELQSSTNFEILEVVREVEGGGWERSKPCLKRRLNEIEEMPELRHPSQKPRDNALLHHLSPQRAPLYLCPECIVTSHQQHKTKSASKANKVPFS